MDSTTGTAAKEDIWLVVLLNKLLKVDNLRRGGWIVANICVLCRSNEELTNHMFNECRYSMAIYNRVHTIPALNTVPTQSLTGQVLTTTVRGTILKSMFILWRE